MLCTGYAHTFFFESPTLLCSLHMTDPKAQAKSILCNYVLSLRAIAAAIEKSINGVCISTRNVIYTLGRRRNIAVQQILKGSGILTKVFQPYSRSSSPDALSYGYNMRSGILSLLGLVLLPLAAPASASPFLAYLPVGTVSLAMASVPLTSSCVQIIYDQSGNRLVRSSSPVSTGAATWGSVTYGCNTWG